MCPLCPVNLDIRDEASCGAFPLNPADRCIIRGYRSVMQVLFIGQSYLDVTLVTDALPSGDDKAVARDYAVSFGGNAVTAAFVCAKLGFSPDLITNAAPDWAGRMLADMASRYNILVHGRPVRRSSVSFILPHEGKRAIVRARDADWLHPFPVLTLDGLRALHLDGHQPDAAFYYAKACRERGILTSLDGGGLRDNTNELLAFIDIAIVAERLCEQMTLSPMAMLEKLQSHGCRIGGVTLGSEGMLWYDEDGVRHHQKALPIPSEKIVDTSGAGDIFHGTYLASWLRQPDQPWSLHFRQARAAATYAIQHLGNEASLPGWQDIAQMRSLEESA
jgi:sugar/nucleoside kinase (ribokinase family)